MIHSKRKSRSDVKNLNAVSFFCDEGQYSGNEQEDGDLDNPVSLFLAH